VKYEIQTRNLNKPHATQWSNDTVGDPNEFDSILEAEQAIRQLRKLEDPSWREGEYRVMPKSK
jgi:hypothetical protein